MDKKIKSNDLSKRFVKLHQLIQTTIDQQLTSNTNELEETTITSSFTEHNPSTQQEQEYPPSRKSLQDIMDQEHKR
jgi:hypothetical protein